MVVGDPTGRYDNTVLTSLSALVTGWSSHREQNRGILSELGHRAYNIDKELQALGVDEFRNDGQYLGLVAAICTRVTTPVAPCQIQKVNYSREILKDLV